MRLMTLLLAMLIAVSANAQQVPATLEPPGEVLAFTVQAKGVQIYECRARKEGSGNEWAFVAPEAELSDASGKKVGTHGAGPFWQASDGSRIEGTVKQRADAPNVGAIPWLLLTTRSTGGNGTMRDITSVQRINTVGGIAPAAGVCEIGATARIPYTADYRFFKAK